MDLSRVLPSFAAFPDALDALVRPLDEETLRERPTPKAWSVLEICVHMLDEEREDFRPRLLSTLGDPAQAWITIDPEGWVPQRDYQSRELAEVLASFRSEREASVRTLRASGEERWENAYEHPNGPIRAGDLLCSWLAHDALHLRQLAQRGFQRVTAACRPFDPGYAGQW